MAEGEASKAEKKLGEDLQKMVIQSKDSAIRSARSFQHSSSTHLQSVKDYLPHAVSQFRTYEDAFFKKCKEGLTMARDHPTATVGVATAAGLLLIRGPRRILFRNTLGRFESEEARYVRIEKSMQNMNSSVDQMKKESIKLLERAHLAEKDMKHGHIELKDVGNQMQNLSKSAYKVQWQAADLVDGLREISGREALRLRAEVASMASLMKRQRNELDKRILKICDLGIHV